MTRLLLLNDTIDHDNWGANACSEWLKRIVQDHMPDAVFSSVLSHWTTDRFYIRPWWLGGGVDTRRRKVVGRFCTPLSFLPKVTDDFDRQADSWQAGQGGPFADEFLGKLKISDAVIFNAEGSTYRNNTSAVRCLFALWIAVTRYGKPAFFTNGSVTLTPVFPILNAMVSRTFQSITAVSVREPCSLDNVHHWIPGVDIALYPDSVFYSAEKPVSIQNPETLDFMNSLQKSDYFCFSLSMLTSSIGGYQAAGIDTTALYDLIRSLQRIVPEAVLMARDGMDQAIIRNLARATGSRVFGPEHHHSSVG
ncbi:MAG TPA: polysaccharide pyruvyl transferase family protein, partial [bacterium]|nr:polysaccharide pyruvyl transferase family protein [bacterium]